jgi:hypothetical protein
LLQQIGEFASKDKNVCYKPSKDLQLLKKKLHHMRNFLLQQIGQFASKGEKYATNLPTFFAI